VQYEVKQDAQGNKYVVVNKTGYDLINHPLYNKGSAFTPAERSEFKLHGLLPSNFFNLEQRREKIYKVFQSKSTALEKHIFLRAYKIVMK